MEYEKPDRTGSLMTVARELARYKLHVVSVQVRWEQRGTVKARDYIFFSYLEKETKFIIRNRSLLYTTEYYQKVRD
jgi:hypothetical protein